MCKILYVEDEDAIRKTMIEVFDLEGITAVAATDGADALALLQSQTFDLMITDLNMPHMQGEEIIQILQENERLKQMPVVVMTGYSEGSRLEALADLGVAAILTKPVGINEILSVVTNLIRTS